MNQQLEQSTHDPAHDGAPARRRHRIRRAVAAFVVVAGVGGAVASVGLGASAASASSADGKVGCTLNYGAYGRNVTMNMVQMPPGTAVVASLYKRINGVNYSQGPYDWARVGSNGFWYDPYGYQNNQLIVTASGPGVYLLWLSYYNAYNQYLGGGFTPTGCYYAT